MEASLGSTAKIAIDALCLVGRSGVLVLGAVDCRQGEGPPSLCLSMARVPLETLACAHRDLPAPRPGLGASAQGLMLIARLPAPSTGGFPRLTLGTTDGAHEVALPGDRIGPPLPELLGRCHWGVVFELLGHAARLPELSGLATDRAGGLGPFARWLESLPLLPASAEHKNGFRRIEAAAAPSGECAVSLALPVPVDPAATIGAVALTFGPGGRRAIALEGPPPLIGDAGIVFYGRPIEAAPLPCPPFELVVQVRRAGGDAFFRTRPAAASAPDFLDALRAGADAAAGADVMDSFTWLRLVLEDRLDALALPQDANDDVAADALAPRVAVLHGIDDPFALRLAFLAAPGIEQRASEVLVLGPRGAAAAVADIFLERGRVPARSSFDLAAAVRRGTYRRCALVPIDAQDLAAAMLDDGLDALFTRRLPGTRLPMLLHLAAVAGRMDGADTMERLTWLMQHGPGGVPGFGRMDGAAGKLVGDHLAEFWRRAAPGFAREDADA